VRCIVGGLPISGGCAVENLKTCKQAVIVANVELYEDFEREILENYAYPMFVIGYQNALKRPADVAYFVNGENGYGVYGYNVNAKERKDYKIAYEKPDLTKPEQGQGMFTALLGYEKIPVRFFRKVAEKIIKIMRLPYVKKGTGCKCFPTRSQGKTVCVITNDSYYYEFPEIVVGEKIVSAHARAKLTEYRVPIEGDRFNVLINNRGADAVELVLEEKK
jgi:hypothetical protein